MKSRKKGCTRGCTRVFCLDVRKEIVPNPPYDRNILLLVSFPPMISCEAHADTCNDCNSACFHVQKRKCLDPSAEMDVNRPMPLPLFPKASLVFLEGILQQCLATSRADRGTRETLCLFDDCRFLLRGAHAHLERPERCERDDGERLA